MIKENKKTHNPIRVGISGLGRSGWGIHAATLEMLPEHYTITAVSDPQPARCEEAQQRFGCRIHTHFEGILSDENVELLVVATPNHLHAQHSIQGLQAGKHVVCEKPAATDCRTFDNVIEVAESQNKIYTTFQNMRYEPSYQKICEVIESGVLGRISQINIHAHKFSRRWDWQTLRQFGGGEIRNKGSHLLDQTLELFGPEQPSVFCHTDQMLSSGDTEDHALIVLTGPGKPAIILELSNTCPYPQDHWLIMGQYGGLRGDVTQLNWKYINPQTLESHTASSSSTANRSYNSDTFAWTEKSWQPTVDIRQSVGGTRGQFYRDLFETIRHDRPLVITPQSVRRQMMVIDQCLQTSYATTTSA